MSTYILWDIDGTLIYNTPTAGVLYLDAIEHVTGARPTVPVENPHGMTEGQLITAILEANGQNPNQIGAVLFDLDILSREQLERGFAREACAGVGAAIAAVASRGWINALLTGNGPNRARYKLLAAGIDPESFDWDHSYFGHESPTRHHLTAGARSALEGETAFIIGDTPNDGLAADSARIPFIAVATGIYSADQLRTTSAVIVIDDLETGLDAVLGAVDAVAEPAPDASTPDTTDTNEIRIVLANDAVSEETVAMGVIRERYELPPEDFGENPDVEVSESSFEDATVEGDNVADESPDSYVEGSNVADENPDDRAGDEDFTESSGSEGAEGEDRPTDGEDLGENPDVEVVEGENGDPANHESDEGDNPTEGYSAGETFDVENTFDNPDGHSMPEYPENENFGEGADGESTVDDTNGEPEHPPIPSPS